PVSAASGAPAPSRGVSSRGRDADKTAGVGGARAPFREYFFDKGRALERLRQQPGDRVMVGKGENEDDSDNDNDEAQP
ncbi:hypothetical protein KEM52_004075, partial [Ascosphaera acerosa]